MSAPAHPLPVRAELPSTVRAELVEAPWGVTQAWSAQGCPSTGSGRTGSNAGPRLHCVCRKAHEERVVCHPAQAQRQERHCFFAVAVGTAVELEAAVAVAWVGFDVAVDVTTDVGLPVGTRVETEVLVGLAVA